MKKLILIFKKGSGTSTTNETIEEQVQRIKAAVDKVQKEMSDNDSEIGIIDCSKTL